MKRIVLDANWFYNIRAYANHDGENSTEYKDEEKYVRLGMASL